MPVVMRLFNIDGDPVATGRANLTARLVNNLLHVGLEDSLPKGNYLQHFDADAFNGGGDALFTKDISKAMRFKNHGEALMFYRTQSKVKPYRPDGKPNRPLTAFNMTFEFVADAP